MLCYLDKHFCSQKCANKECSRNFNDEVMEGARAWWGTEGTPPIDFADMRTDVCGFVPVYTADSRRDKMNLGGRNGSKFDRWADQSTEKRMSKTKKDLERVERNKKLSHDAFSIINTKFSD